VAPSRKAADGGNEALNVWLKRFALMNVANDTARVYVAHRSDGIVGARA
jgi:hypothetical protein